MQPTDEQAEAVRLFTAGGNLAIEAGAGTGKTSTLRLIADSTMENGQYVVFNKALADEAAAKFPLHVPCNTAHSLAYRALGHRYGERLRSSRRVPGWELARMFRVPTIDTSDFQDKPKRLADGYLAALCSRAITSFCQSADLEIKERHFEYVDGLDAPDDLGRRTYERNTQLRQALLPIANRMWDDLQGLTGSMPYKHEHYLKAWQLSGPRIAAKFVLFDESQDANPVMADIVAQQEQYGIQLVYVGDSQQEIYAWTGAVNALAQVKVDHRTYLSQSFRFGQAIADQANIILRALESPLQLRGNPAIQSTVGHVANPRAVLTRTNATGITFLLDYQMAGERAYMVGGGKEVLAFAEAAEQLINTGATSFPELACFSDWKAVQQYVETDPNGEELKLNVGLVDRFGTKVIIDAIRKMPDERTADVIISTAHKSKGREWDTVRLASDFPAMAEDKPSQRLLYVAMTRAKLELDMGALELDDYDTAGIDDMTPAALGLASGLRRAGMDLAAGPDRTVIEARVVTETDAWGQTRAVGGFGDVGREIPEPELEPCTCGGAVRDLNCVGCHLKPRDCTCPSQEALKCWCGDPMARTDIRQVPFGHLTPGVHGHPAALKKPVTRHRKMKGEELDTPQDRAKVDTL